YGRYPHRSPVVHLCRRWRTASRDLFVSNGDLLTQRLSLSPTRRLMLVAPSSSYRLEDFLDAARAVGCSVTVVADSESAIAGPLVSVAFHDPEGAAQQLVAMVG